MVNGLGCKTYSEEFNCDSSAAQVFPSVVMTTPAMLTNTATTFDRFKVSWPKNTPMKRVNSPEVEDNTVVLATLVRARAALDRYCIIKNSKQISLPRVKRGHFQGPSKLYKQHIKENRPLLQTKLVRGIARTLQFALS